MKALTKAIAVSLGLISVAANAGTVVCGGTIDQIHLHASDTMMIKLSSMNTSIYFCRTNTSWSPAGANGLATSPETCRTLVAMLLAGKLAGKTISGMYFDGDEVPATCNSWGPWKSANIRYFEWAD